MTGFTVLSCQSLLHSSRCKSSQPDRPKLVQYSTFQDIVLVQSRQLGAISEPRGTAKVMRRRWARRCSTGDRQPAHNRQHASVTLIYAPQHRRYSIRLYFTFSVQCREKPHVSAQLPRPALGCAVIHLQQLRSTFEACSFNCCGTHCALAPSKSCTH
jgi:hypothetical protein